MKIIKALLLINKLPLPQYLKPWGQVSSNDILVQFTNYIFILYHHSFPLNPLINGNAKLTQNVDELVKIIMDLSNVET
jgi:hypothetical protein